MFDLPSFSELARKGYNRTMSLNWLLLELYMCNCNTGNTFQALTVRKVLFPWAADETWSESWVPQLMLFASLPWPLGAQNQVGPMTLVRTLQDTCICSKLSPGSVCSSTLVSHKVLVFWNMASTLMNCIPSKFKCWSPNPQGWPSLVMEALKT